MTESILNSENKMKEKIINKLTPKCRFHNGEKELYICITCGLAFCENCKEKHKDHKTLEKKEILKYIKELKENKENLIKNLKENGLNENISEVDVFKDLREKIYYKIDSISETVNNIQKKYNDIYSDFKNDFINLYPFILEYIEKVDILFEESQKETTIRLEKNFIDFYCKYSNIKNNSNKINETLVQIKKKLKY